MSVAADVRDTLEPRRQEMVDLLGQLVSIESPSDAPDALRRMADTLTGLFGEFGSIARLEPGNLVLRVGDERTKQPHALALCHYDTVWPMGTLASIPFSVDQRGVARGPGCFDMKAGIVILYFALKAVQHQLQRPLRVLFTCDEEVGSPSSRPVIEQHASGAVVAYVLESPLPGGTLKTARKGTGDYWLRIEGRAAHAGVEPQKGISAIQELAHQTLALHALNNFLIGTTVNVGVVHGGTRPNVVAAAAEAHVDVRVATLAEAERIDQAIRGLTPALPGAQLTVTGGLNRPPMERSAAMAELFAKARAIAESMDVPLDEGSTGGGSDGNFTASFGVPTLDGLGAEGEGAHAAHEHVLTDSLPRRAGLLAGLLTSV